MPSERDLAVIVPVYNTLPELNRCLDSLLNQDMGGLDYEIVAVDDGSTDGSGDLLDEYSERYEHVRVIHQENSGWPGQPRNLGVASSKSRYVFFVDADDYLGPESLRRQVEFADQHSSDIVVPVLLEEEGASPRGALWSRGNAVDADRNLLFKTLSPQKLFRRDFLSKYSLCFPEGFVPLEDGLLLSRAYWLADRVSVLTDYGYYYKSRKRDHGGNISLHRKTPGLFIDSVAQIIDNVRAHADDAATADRVVLDVYRRKALKYLLAKRFLGAGSVDQEEWVSAIAPLADSRISPELEARLPVDACLRSRAARTGDVAVVRGLAEAVRAGTIPAAKRDGKIVTDLPGASMARPLPVEERLTVSGRLVASRTSRRGFHLEIEVSMPPYVAVGALDWVLVVARRDNDQQLAVPLRPSRRAATGAPTHARLSGFLRAARFPDAEPSRWDAYVQLNGHPSTPARVSAKGDAAAAAIPAPAARTPRRAA